MRSGLRFRPRYPSAEIRVIRTYWRQRADHVSAVSTCIQRMQKTLTQMNIQLANVISDLSAWTGRRIMRAMLAGDRDPQALAVLSHPGIHASLDTIAKSLERTWRADLLFVLQQEVTMSDASAYDEHRGLRDVAEEFPLFSGRATVRMLFRL
jgi:transposase